MAEIDPYATLGVTRAASHDEIARAYRRLAKRWHPDSAAGPKEQAAHAVSMARINQAWHVLSNPVRRARWDAAHPLPGGGPHWSAGRPSPAMATAAGARATTAAEGTWVPPVVQRPQARATGSASVRDSGWLAAMVAAVVLIVFIGAVGVVAQMQSSAGEIPWPDAEAFETEELSFAHDPGWHSYAGDDPAATPHGIVVHVLSYELDGERPCTSISEPCDAVGEAIPDGEVSVIIVQHREGSPSIPQPVYERPFGLDADEFIGGEPAAFEWRAGTDAAQAWWQLSPPGFPDRWYEVYADIRGGTLEQEAGLAAVRTMLSTLVFGPEIRGR